MEFDYLALVARWLHIAAAIVAIGAPFFIRFGLLPAALKTLPPDQHAALRDAISVRWRKVVYLSILTFLVTGLYTFFVVARWKELPKPDRSLYHMLFGFKTLAAFGIFFLASALAGRAKAFQAIRNNAKLWLSVVLLLAVVIIVCSGIMRYLPRNPAQPAPLPAATLPR